MPDQLYRDPGTERVNERIRLFPCLRNAESHWPVSKRKKSCRGIQKVSRWEFRALPPLPAHAKQIPRHRLSFTRCWCQSVRLRESSAIFQERLRTENKRIPRNAERSSIFLYSRSSRKFFRNNIILEAPFWHFSPMHFFSCD